MKRRCCKCRDLAIWHYAPCSEGKIEADSYYCDGCVSRGCSCNIVDYEDPDGEEYRDESGRLVPCCEYDFSEEGYEKNTIIDDSDKYDTEFDET